MFQMSSMTKNDGNLATTAGIWTDSLALPAADMIMTAEAGVPAVAGNTKACTGIKLEPKESGGAFDVGAAAAAAKLTYTAVNTGASKWTTVLEIT